MELRSNKWRKSAIKGTVDKYATWDDDGNPIEGDVADLTSGIDLSNYQALSQKGQPNGYAPLDSSSKVDSYVSVGTTATAGKLQLATDAESSSSKAVAANDSRLSNTRTPVVHDLLSYHSISGLTSGHFLRATSATSVGFSPIVMTDLGTGTPNSTNFLRGDGSWQTAGGAGTPATTVTDEMSFGINKAVGISTNYAREDHTHGTPTNPITAHEAAGDPHPAYVLESNIGVTVQAYSSILDAIAATTWTGATSITTLGTIATGIWNGTDIAIADGGTGSSTASGARSNLGLAIGSNVQAWSSILDAIAATTWTGATSITTLGIITTGTWQGNTIAAIYGGTGQTSYAVGDVLFASTTTALSKLSPDTAGYILTDNGVGVAPSWQSPAATAVGGGSIPTLPLLSTELHYSLDPDRPHLVQRTAYRYPKSTIADMESSTQGFSLDNTGNGAIEMVATGGLNPGVERGYIRITPNVAGSYAWQSAVRTAERNYKTYAALDAGAGSVEAQVWIAGMRVPSSVTGANYRLFSFVLSDATNASRVVRTTIYYNGSWNIYNDSVLSATTVATTAGVANDVVWFAFVRTGQTVQIYYNFGGGTVPPVLSSFTAWTTHTNLLNGGAAVAVEVGFTYETGSDTSTAFFGDILYYDDSGAYPDNVAARWRRSVLGVPAYLPVPACGFSVDQPELIIAQGICTTGLTQDKIRAILVACENHRTGLDTCSWEWKVERNTSNSYSGGSFAAAASVTIAGSGPYIRVTVRPAADGTSPGSIDLVTLRQWSLA